MGKSAATSRRSGRVRPGPVRWPADRRPPSRHLWPISMLATITALMSGRERGAQFRLVEVLAEQCPSDQPEVRSDVCEFFAEARCAQVHDRELPASDGGRQRLGIGPDSRKKLSVSKPVSSGQHCEVHARTMVGRPARFGLSHRGVEPRLPVAPKRSATSHEAWIADRQPPTGVRRCVVSPVQSEPAGARFALPPAATSTAVEHSGERSSTG